jgi:hypothetical protein
MDLRLVDARSPQNAACSLLVRQMGKARIREECEEKVHLDGGVLQSLGGLSGFGHYLISFVKQVGDVV